MKKNKTNLTETIGATSMGLLFVLFWMLITFSVMELLKLGMVTLGCYTISNLLLWYAFGPDQYSKVSHPLLEKILGFITVEAIVIVPCIIILIIKGLFF